MNAVGKIATLFDNDITRQIEEVIKVDQTSADRIALEIGEYVVTDAIRKHFVSVLEKYQTAPQNPSDNVRVVAEDCPLTPPRGSAAGALPS